jgi:hypothetical protein
MNRCQLCDATIAWMTTPSGLRIPVDPVPNPKGPLRIDELGQVRILYIDDRAMFHGLRYTSHWATCPATQQRKGPPDAG